MDLYAGEGPEDQENPKRIFGEQAIPHESFEPDCLARIPAGHLSQDPP